jgi:23S rRNA (pseudouridine1915-N3)-methyltransferase
MIEIYIFADSYKHYEEGVKEFQKRLRWKVKIIKLKPCKKWEPFFVVETETEKLIEKLKKENAFKIVLSPNWKQLKTEELLYLTEKNKQLFPKTIFIIGWANWLNYFKLKPFVSFELSLWKMIIPHSLALLVLMEQIYRIEMIKKGSKYHK